MTSPAFGDEAAAVISEGAAGLEIVDAELPWCYL
jgi:hypothetical protein